MQMKWNLTRRGVSAAVLLLGMAAAFPAAASAADPNAAMEKLNHIEILDLTTAARIALQSNPSLAAAQARVKQAAEVVKQARAPYYPSLDAAASANRVKLSDQTIDRQYGPYLVLAQNLGLPAVNIDNPYDDYKASVTASWLVFNGFARKFSLAMAHFGENASAAARNDAQRLLLSSVTYTFLQAQLAQENIAIARADEAFNKRELEDARLRYKVGTGAQSDVLNFEIRVNSARSSVIQQKRTYRNNLTSLAALMGVPQARFPDKLRLAELGPTQPSELASPNPAELVQTALALRPDLRQDEWTVQQAQAGVKKARSGYYPSIVLSGSYVGERPDDLAFDQHDFGNSVGLSLNWNLFAGGLTRAQVGESKARLFELKRLRDNAALNVAADVKRVITQIGAAQRQLALQETNTGLVHQQRDLVEKEYNAGVGSLVRLNEAQRDLTVAQAQLALARVALRLSWYDLQTATGQIVKNFEPSDPGMKDGK